MNQSSQQLKIMILEDNVADVFLLKEALKETGVDFTAEVFSDGDSANRYVRSSESAHIGLAILDLNVPRRDGSEVLACIRQTEHLKDIPVVVLSSTPHDMMIRRASAADACLTKPVEFLEFLDVGRQILECYREARARRMIA